MADVTVNAQLDAACEKFRKILEKQLVRIEDMKSQGDFVDYAKVETLRIGVCGGDGIGPIITNEAARVLEFLLKEDVDAGKIDCIIVKDLSRFGRNHYECDRYMQVVFPQKGVRFIAITDHYDSNNETSETDMFLIPIKNIMNDNYCRDMSVKIRTQLETKRKSGECVKNFAPYGYVKDPEDRHKLIIDEYAAFVVKEIFNMKLRGYSVNAIVDELNERSIKSPSEYKKSQNSKYTANLQRRSVARWSTTAISHI